MQSNAPTTFRSKCYADAASRKRSHDEESEGGPAVKKSAGDSHGKALTCVVHLCFNITSLDRNLLV